MSELSLILYSRQGCCLCEGLEERLRGLSLKELDPATKLVVIDIDKDELDQNLWSRYNLEVPVLAIRSPKTNHIFDLPRISPKLKEERLFKWLQMIIKKSL